MFYRYIYNSNSFQDAYFHGTEICTNIDHLILRVFEVFDGL